MDIREKIDKIITVYGQTFSDEICIRLPNDNPSAYYQLLNASVLFSARISHEISIHTARHLLESGLTTAEKVQQSSWEEKVKILDEGGYGRYDERTATFLGDIAEQVLAQYQGDLRKLREKANREPGSIRAALKAFKGLGDVGAGIFCREVQGQWDELYPYADRKSLQVAEKLGLPKDTHQLSELVPKKDFPRLIAALLRVDLKRDYELKGGEEQGNSGALAQKTKEELYQMAREQNISGRSEMSKEELLEALKH